MNDTWVQRCAVCGDYAHGHGEIPELPEHWVCGDCLAEEKVIDLDMPPSYI